ncbi:MAG: sulfite exporter TauE/SafE family protein [Microbacterium sp.]|uniref:sulfite exporter TauE/SafE family protein n=1 Tax=Microbacterium sp. TaxID=51671 RepID=UPI003A8C2F8B
MAELSVVAWALLAMAAVVIGLSKTAIPGSATVSVAIFAAVMPAKESTGTILLLLILADLFAITIYRRTVNWRVIVRLVPAVVVGVLLGVAFLAWASDEWVKRTIGIILLGVIAVTLLRRWLSRAAADDRPHRVAAAAYGALSGFTTMVANAAGPVMSMYLLAARFPVKEFLGTTAWFFFLVNVSKVPFSIGLGLIAVPGLLLDLVLVPLVVAGALLGRWWANRIDQRLFERVVIAVTVVGALYLVWPW